MAVATQDRDTKQRDTVSFEFPVKASSKIYAGTIVVIDSSGYALKGATATGLRAVGRAEEQVDNSSGSNGDKTVKVKRACFRFANSSSGDLITLADVGTDCYIVDDQTVAKTNGTSTRSVAGKVRDVDSIGVWVEF